MKETAGMMRFGSALDALMEQHLSAGMPDVEMQRVLRARMFGDKRHVVPPVSDPQIPRLIPRAIATQDQQRET